LSQSPQTKERGIKRRKHSVTNRKVSRLELHDSLPLA